MIVIRNGEIDLSTGELVNVTDKAVINKVISCVKREELNGEYTLSFESVLDEKIAAYIDKYTTFRLPSPLNNVYEFGNELFQIAKYTKKVNSDKTVTVEVEAEHITYSLNDEEYYVTDFTSSGSTGQHIYDILSGTKFDGSPGGNFPDDPVTISFPGTKSRRDILYSWAEAIGGELQFMSRLEGITWRTIIVIFPQRGSANIPGMVNLDEVRAAIPDKNIRILSESSDVTKLDENGNPTTSYSCEPIGDFDTSLMVGDTVLFWNRPSGIQNKLRVTAMSTNPYNPIETKLEFGVIRRGVEETIRNIEDYESNNSGGGSGGIDDVPTGTTIPQARLPGRWVDSESGGIDDVPVGETTPQSRLNGRWVDSESLDPVRSISLSTLSVSINGDVYTPNYDDEGYIISVVDADNNIMNNISLNKFGATPQEYNAIILSTIMARGMVDTNEVKLITISGQVGAPTTVKFLSGRFYMFPSGVFNSVVNTSIDGINWSQVLDSSGRVVDATSGLNLWAVSAYTNNPDTSIMNLSINGVEFNPIIGNANSPFIPVGKLAYGGGQLICISSNRDVYSDGISYDGATWEKVNTGIDGGALANIIFDNGLFIAVGLNGIQYSYNGVDDWSQNVCPDQDWESSSATAVYGNGIFIAVGKNGKIATSNDGITWSVNTNYNLPGEGYLAYGNGLFIFTSPSGYDILYTSTNGVDWVNKSTAFNVVYRGAAYGSGKFVFLFSSSTRNGIAYLNH